MHSLWQDIRYGVRMLARNPGFTTVAVLTLALGIGANTAIFSVVNSVLLHPLPFADSDRLVWVWGHVRDAERAAVSPPDFADYRAQNRSFEHLGAFFVLGAMPENLSFGGHGAQVKATMVTAEFFEALGAKPLLGRTFAASDEKVSDPQTIILSCRLWQEKFGADRTIVGRSAAFSGADVTVVGVMPPTFHYPPETEAWFPAPMLAAGMQQRPTHNLRPVGLRKRGVTVAQAQADLDAIALRLADQYPDSNRGWSVRLQPMHEAIVGPVRAPLLLLLGAVALVLLIACVNVANLLLARNNAREKEVAIRTSLGAGRVRLVRQLLTESAILGLIGGAVGVFLATWGVEVLRSLSPGSLPRLDEIKVDATVLAFTAAVSVLTGVLFGLVPAFQASKLNLQDALKEGSRSSSGAGHQRLRSVLVVSEVTLSVALLVAAGLLLHSLWQMLHVNPGFDPNRILTTQILLSPKTYSDDARQVAFFRGLLAKIGSLPSVETAGGVSELPLSGQYNDTFFTTAASPPKEMQSADDASIRLVAGNYFQAMRVPLLEGRFFSEQDRHDGPRTMIVNEPFVKTYLSKEDPIGKHLWVWEGQAGFVSCELVGVVGGMRHFALQTPPQPEMYLPYAQSPRHSISIVVRGSGDPVQLASAVRAAVTGLDPDEAVSAFKTMPQIVAESAAGDRFNAFLLGLFGGLALVLAAAGIYGVISYAVTQRTHEIGIRLALGADPSGVLGMVLGQGMRLVGIGLALGLAAAASLTRLMASQLYGISAIDPATFAGAAMALAAVALLACYVPARRAMKVDPIVALRYE